MRLPKGGVPARDYAASNPVPRRLRLTAATGTVRGNLMTVGSAGVLREPTP